MAESSHSQHKTFLAAACALIGAVMLYQMMRHLTQFPGDGARLLLVPVFLASLFGIYKLWRGRQHGWWIFTVFSVIAGLWSIVALDQPWTGQLWYILAFPLVFRAFYGQMKKSRTVDLFLRRVLGRIGDALMGLLNVPWIVALIEKVPPLDAFINRVVINRIVKQVRNRPHPFSTRSDYTSWASLTDTEWSARHLGVSPLDQESLPSWEEISPLFERTSGTQRMCPKSTCLFPSFAQYLTDGFIRTQTNETVTDRLKKNTSNHNIDLCPLYGRTEEQTVALRVKDPAPEDRGKLKSQLLDDEEFAPFLFEGDEIKPEFAVLDKPLGLENLTNAIDKAIAEDKPEVAEKVRAKRGRLFAFGGDRANSVPQTAMINTVLLREHNRLAAEMGKRYPDWDDDRLFETARNIVIVQFIKIVVEDYINHIAPTEFRLKADPKAAWNANWNRPNWITTEFSLLYRWHALIPDEIRWGETTHKTNPAYFMEMKPLLDGGLAQAFEDMSAQATGELGPRNTTKFLMHVEQASVEQGRFCQLRPFTDYLEYLQRLPIESMSDISSDREVAKILKKTYGDVDRVDFFVGLFCEDRVKNAPLPRTILSFVALDAFSQALTNPLLSEHIFKPPQDPEVEHPTFSRYGWEQIAACGSMRDLVLRNVPAPAELGFVGMTQRGWVRA
ncbi:peroxidase family protein [uncultured Roseobacter sp.]|uniref:peroxidase family protein n=1 Tax=uncultured Roseobacter sp. TaxID=114847 RepID=UPI00262BAC91|nr:peroxidase family protein [uncultured Roseobacter sp.]